MYPTCATCMENLIPNDGELCGACVKSERAAAEERGRQAGIEAAAKFVEQFDGCMHGECFVAGIRALAADTP